MPRRLLAGIATSIWLPREKRQVNRFQRLEKQMWRAPWIDGSNRTAHTQGMYLISWIEEESKLETSLGGRVTAEEMKVVYEELQEILSDVEEQPYLMVIDYSLAKSFDVEADMILLDIKEFCLSRGAEKVISVVRDTEEIVAETSRSLQNVLIGHEDFVTDPSVIKWTPTVAVSDIVRRAA